METKKEKQAKLSKQDVELLIINGVKKGSLFKDIRKKIIGWERRAIKNVVLELMANKKITEIPKNMFYTQERFPKILPLTNNCLDLTSIIDKTYFLKDEKIIANYHIGKDKVTITVRPIASTER